MNQYFSNNRFISAKFLAGITIVSLLLSAFPAAFFVANAATDLITSTSTTLDINTVRHDSVSVDASGYENLNVSFTYNAETLDNGDDFVFGFSVGGVDTELDSVSGKNENGANATTDETDSVSVNLPAGAQVAGLTLYFSMLGNQAGDDSVIITDYVLSGDQVQLITDAPTYFCKAHPDGSFNKQTLTPAEAQTLNGGADGGLMGSGVNANNIIPPFGDFVGYNWANNLLNQTTWQNDCEEEVVGVVYGCMDPEADNYSSDATERGDVKCEYPPVEVSQCINVDENLLKNASFEEPEVVSSENWSYFSNILDWVITALDNGAQADGELHRGWTGNEAADAEQYAELDPRESVKMSQTVVLQAGGLYELSWAFAPRHDINANENQLSILVDGTEVATEGPATLAAGLDSSDWTRSAVTFTATANSAEIAFADAGATSDSFGTFLDDTKLCLVREPVVEEPEVCSLEGEIIDYTEYPLQNDSDPVNPNRRGLTALDTIGATSNFLGKESVFVESDFFSLGIEGFLVYEFTNKVAVDGPGDDIAIWEVTGGNSGQSDEKAEVFVSEDGIAFISLGVATGDASFDISGMGLDFVKFVKLVDQSSGVQGGNGDGFDVDAITIIEGSCDDEVVNPDPNNQNQFTFSGYKFDNKNQDRDQDAGEERLYDWDFNMYKEVAGIWTFVASTTVNPANAPQNPGKFVFPQQQEAGVYHVCEEQQLGWDQVYQDWSGTPFHIVTNNLSPNAGVEGPYCATAVYTDEADRSKAAHFGNFLKEVPTQYADVTVCKVDEQENQLSGWTLMLQGDKVGDYSVPANNPAGVDTAPLAAGASYIVLSDGTWDNNRGPLNIVDAEYSTEDNWVASIMDGFTGFGADILELFVGGTNGDWGAYNGSHQYAQSLVPASDGAVNLAINDTNYGDNSGELSVTVYEGYTGVTEVNGCVVFEDVPYGDYEVAEIMQTGYENASGLGLVEVNDETESFTVVNKDLAFIPPCELEIVSDGGTLVAETNMFATSTYVHDNWTEDIDGATWVWVTEYVENPTDDEIYTFMETFTADGATSAVLDVAADNTLLVKVNGTTVLDQTDQNNFISPQTVNILSALNPTGENTIEFIVKNNGVTGSNQFSNPAGVLYKITVAAAANCAVTTEPGDVDEPTPLYRIGGYKWDDANGNGLYDTAESESTFDEETISGWIITLSQGETSVSTTTTDGSGNYFFDVPAGTWTVTEEEVAGWTQTGRYENGVPVSSEDELDSCTFTIPSENETEPFYTCSFGNQEDAPVVVVTPQTDEDEEVGQRRSGSGSTGTRISRVPAPTPLVLGATTDAPQFCPFLEDFMQMGAENDSMEVMKLQIFLNVFKGMFGGTENPMTGTFDATTDANVKAFQQHFAAEILDPWFERGIVPHNRPTGFVYKTTLWKINSIVCPEYAVLPEFAGEDLTENVDL